MTNVETNRFHISKSLTVMEASHPGNFANSFELKCPFLATSIEFKQILWQPDLLKMLSRPRTEERQMCGQIDSTSRNRWGDDCHGIELSNQAFLQRAFSRVDFS